MKQIRDSHVDEFADFADDDIDNVNDPVLLTEILTFAQPLKNARINLKNYIRKRLPNILTVIPDFQKQFDKVTAYMDQDDISSLL